MIFKSFSQTLKSSIWLQGLLVAAIAYPVGVMAQSKTEERMSFDSGSMEEGESLTVKFKKSGTFNVKCAIHPKMNLEVTVK